MNSKKIKTFIFLHKKRSIIIAFVTIISIAIFANFTSVVRASFGTWGDTSLINACQDSRGRVILVAPGTSCNTSETQVAWLKDVDAGSGLNISRNSTGATLSVGTLTNAQLGTITKIVTASLEGWNSETTMAPGYGVRMMSTGSTTVGYTFAIPYDYQGGDITVREWYLVNDATGTAKISRNTNKVSSGGTISSLGSASGDLTVSSGGDAYRTYTISSSNVTAGDIFQVLLARNGDDSADTMGRLDIRAIAVEYTGIK